MANRILFTLSSKVFGILLPPNVFPDTLAVVGVGDRPLVTRVTGLDDVRFGARILQGMPLKMFVFRELTRVPRDALEQLWIRGRSVCQKISRFYDPSGSRHFLDDYFGLS